MSSLIRFDNGDLCSGNANPNIPVIHGYCVTNNSLWYKKWGRALMMPVSFRKNDWVERLKTCGLNQCDRIIGHSLGALAILRYMEVNDVKFREVHLVAPGLRPSLQSLYDTGFYGDFDWPTIRSKCNKFIIYWSRDDEYVKADEITEIANNLGAEIILQEDCGHYIDHEPPLQLN